MVKAANSPTDTIRPCDVIGIAYYPQKVGFGGSNPLRGTKLNDTDGFGRIWRSEYASQLALALAQRCSGNPCCGVKVPTVLAEIHRCVRRARTRPVSKTVQIGFES